MRRWLSCTIMQQGHVGISSPETIAGFSGDTQNAAHSLMNAHSA